MVQHWLVLIWIRLKFNHTKLKSWRKTKVNHRSRSQCTVCVYVFSLFSCNVYNDILRRFFSFRTHLAKRRRILMVELSDADQNGAGPSEIVSVKLLNQHNGEQAVTANLNLDERRPPNEIVVKNECVATTTSAQNDQVVPIGPVKHENNVLFESGEFIWVHDDASDPNIQQPVKIEPINQTMVNHYEARIKQLETRNRNLEVHVEALQTRVLRDMNSYTSFTPPASSTKKNESEKENFE